MSYELIMSEITGHVRIIRMDRPDKLNAMSPQVDYEIIHQLHTHAG